MNNERKDFHLSITGLRIKPGHLNRLRFAYHAQRSYRQLRRAHCNLHVTIGVMNDVHHTVTAWTDHAAMMAYVRSGAHQIAMRAFARNAIGRTAGFTTEQLPNLQEAHALWLQKAGPYSP